MTQATPQQLAFGKTDTTKLYATIKNGNIYSLRAAVPASAGPALIAKIQAAGKINLKHWECVRIKLSRFEQEDIEHASKMWEFEKSGDKAGAIAYLESRTTQQVAS